MVRQPVILGLRFGVTELPPGHFTSNAKASTLNLLSSARLLGVPTNLVGRLKVYLIGGVPKTAQNSKPKTLSPHLRSPRAQLLEVMAFMP